MRKIIFLFLIFSLFIFTGCDFNLEELDDIKEETENTDEETESTDEETENKDEENDDNSNDINEDVEEPIVLDEFSIKDLEYNKEDNPNYFDASFSNININTLQNKISFKLTINDPNYYRFNYYLVIYNKTKDSNKYVVHYTIVKPMYTDDRTFYIDYPSDIYQIVIGKSKTSMRDEDVKLDPVTGFEFQFLNTFMVKNIGECVIDLQEENDDNIDEFKLDFTIKDRQSSLSKMRVVIKPQDIDVVAYEAIINPILYKKGDMIEVRDLVVNNLTPGIKYNISIYGTGNNNLRDYEDFFLASTNYTTQKHISTLDTFYGLHSKYNNYKLHDENYEVNLTIEKLDAFIGKNPLLDFRLNVYDKSNNLVHSIPAEVGTKSYFIDNEYLDLGYKVKVEEINNNLSLALHGIIYNIPKIEANAYKETDDLYNINLNIYEQDARIINHSLQIRKEFDSIPYLSLSNHDLIIGSNNITVKSSDIVVKGSFTSNIQFYITYKVSYTLFGKVYEETLYHSRSTQIFG